ncbi:MAG: DUF3298 and DUF4163 domain-containing protein [Eubacteriales bacterium]|nr:DUF3298 and DUF4163 domain-containing protein [Eubacteriales bacterium]
MRKKRIWFVLAVLIGMTAAVFSACGKKTVSPSETQKSTESGAETEESETQEEMESQSVPQENAAGQVAGGGVGSVHYEVRLMEKQYEADDGTVIFEIRLAYPVLQGEEEGAKQINRFFQEWSEKKLKESEEDEDSTRQSALEVYRESKDAGWPGPWSESYEVTSVKTWGGYVSVLMDSYLYEGGAHGMPYREGHVFRISDGQEVELSDLTDKTQDDWDKLLRAGFADKIAQGEEAQYYEDAMDLIKERDMKDTGYYFAETGIVFYLPPYEIAPYSTGYVEILVPFEEAGISEYQERQAE